MRRASHSHGKTLRPASLHLHVHTTAPLILILTLGMALLPRLALGQGAMAISLPQGLPRHFGIGLSGRPDASGLDGWMPRSGIPWDYAYQYLAGGVNTPAAWQRWNAGAQFPLQYARAAARYGYVPVFTYYELLQSNGPCVKCSEAERDLAHLNDHALMAGYYRNFALLMQRLGSGTHGGVRGFGKPAIVHVEPDLSGYAEQAVLDTRRCSGHCTGQGNNPSFLRAAVSSTGVPSLVHYPDTYQGFNWALLHLRDLYAPNVRLALHVSNWANITDVASTTSAVDATGLGWKAGLFAAASGAQRVPHGVRPYDLLFNDVADRDAGQYKYALGNPSVWWDRLNIRSPNFHRWEAYISSLTSTARLPLMVWQIPEGNQYFRTENNTKGHYQDNRAEYFFGHIAELTRAGVVGLLFGRGNEGSTTHTDDAHDGITNPPATCTRDGLSSGQICASHSSTVADDDGGYLRLAARRYYAGGAFPLVGHATAPAIPAATPQAATSASAPIVIKITDIHVAWAEIQRGHTQPLTVTVVSNQALSKVLIDLEVYGVSRSGQTTGRVFQAVTATKLRANQVHTSTATWTVPTTAPTGAYRLKAGVFAVGWSRLYIWDDQGATFRVQAG